MNKTITLVGIMGSGKTSIAKKLAKKLKIQCIDTDLKIKEITKYSVTDLIANNQKELLDKTEIEIVKQYSATPHVISTGDNTINNPKAWRFLLKNTITVWINISLKQIMDRLRPTENRPLLNVEKEFTFKDLQTLYIQRKKFYKQSNIELRNFRKQSMETLLQLLQTTKPAKTIIQ